uniref:Tyrosine specific protein phosphatases domain-containing protein n=1 Tax=Scylla olivacea TaxID=85551 RepID=A0A0P4VZL7_SCYOL
MAFTLPTLKLNSYIIELYIKTKTYEQNLHIISFYVFICITVTYKRDKFFLQVLHEAQDKDGGSNRDNTGSAMGHHLIWLVCKMMTLVACNINLNIMLKPSLILKVPFLLPTVSLRRSALQVPRIWSFIQLTQPRLGMKRNRPNSCEGAADSLGKSCKKPSRNPRDGSQVGSHKKAAAAAKVGRSRFFKIQEELKSDRMARERRRTLAEDLILSLHYMKHDAEVRCFPDHAADHFSLPVNLLEKYLTYSFHPSNTLRREFQQLRESRPALPTTAALRPSNASKNRSPHIVAGDQYRCVLRPVTQRNRRGNSVWDILHRAQLEDYINATVINTEFPRYWPTIGEERVFLGTTTPIVVTRAPPEPVYSSHTAAEEAEGMGKGDSKVGEMDTAGYVNLLKNAWMKENEDTRISGKSTGECKGDEKQQRLHGHTKRPSSKCAAGRREAGEGAEERRGYQLGQGRKTDGRRVREANEEKYQRRTRRKATTRDEFKEGKGGDQRFQEGETAVEDWEKDSGKVEHYQWKEEKERVIVEQAQGSPHYFLSRLYLWVGGSSCSGRRLIPHFHFPGGLRDPGAVLHLLHAVLYNQSVVTGPVVVHCPDGADLSGVFMALARLVQQEVNRRREEDEEREEEEDGKKKDKEEEGSKIMNGRSVNVYEAVSHVRRYLPCAVRQLTSYRFLYQCMHTFLTSPPDMFGFWVVRRPLLDARLTALRPYSTKKLLRRVQKEYPNLLQSRESYKQDTEEGSDLRVTLFQEVIRRVQKEMRGGSREKNSRREEGWTEKGLDVGCE